MIPILVTRIPSPFILHYCFSQGLTRRHYNQIANYALTQTEINIAIGDRRPADYFSHLGEQANGGATKYGAIATPDDLRRNLGMHAIPVLGGVEGQGPGSALPTGLRH